MAAADNPAAEGKRTFLVSMEAVATGKTTEDFVTGFGRSDALEKFLRRRDTVVALLSEKPHRFTVSDNGVPESAHMFDPVIRMPAVERPRPTEDQSTQSTPKGKD
jgi:hypothetical protein